MPSKHTEAQVCRIPFEIIDGGVTAAKGFRASAVNCGIKSPEATRLDLALIVSDSPTVTDAVFTTNKVRAACVRVCQQHIKESDTRAIIANSGNANACTGVQGIQDAKAMTKAVAEQLSVKMRQVLVCSTGIIGMPLPIQRIIPKVPDAVAKLNDQGSEDAMRAIMTNVVDRIDFLTRNRDTLMGVPTGFTMLDRLLGGFQKSDLIILAGRPGMGKSSFAVSVAQNAARVGERCSITRFQTSEPTGSRKCMPERSVGPSSGRAVIGASAEAPSPCCIAPARSSST